MVAKAYRYIYDETVVPPAQAGEETRDVLYDYGRVAPLRMTITSPPYETGAERATILTQGAQRGS